MGLEFNGLQIPGLFGQVQIGGRLAQVQRTKFWGVNGESEIRGGWGSRPIIIQHTLYGDYQNNAQAMAFLEQLDSMTAKNGALRLSNAVVSKTFYDCTLDGVEKPMLPMKDVAGTLDGGYWADITLHFTQLSADQ